MPALSPQISMLDDAKGTGYQNFLNTKVSSPLCLCCAWVHLLCLTTPKAQGAGHLLCSVLPAGAAGAAAAGTTANAAAALVPLLFGAACGLVPPPPPPQPPPRLPPPPRAKLRPPSLCSADTRARITPHTTASSPPSHHRPPPKPRPMSECSAGEGHCRVPSQFISAVFLAAFSRSLVYLFGVF